jgi:hypothetical protein
MAACSRQYRIVPFARLTALGLPVHVLGVLPEQLLPRMLQHSIPCHVRLSDHPRGGRWKCSMAVSRIREKVLVAVRQLLSRFAAQGVQTVA